MAERVSALAQVYDPGIHGRGEGGAAGIRLRAIPTPSIWQVAAWPDTLAAAGGWLAALGGSETVPGPGQWTAWGNGRLARVEPLKWWTLGSAAEAVARLGDIDPALAVALDLSHAFVPVRIEGKDAAELLNRFMALDFSLRAFPSGSVASGLFDHLSATVLRDGDGFEAMLPRSYAQYLWEEFVETAGQFGVEVLQ